ncbi:MAG TPA: hypothetical protein VJN96_16050 [Vicinamibacterales bacterium]|nr:hypothetical protein [Vicinamibacterales bacterium]
MQTSSVPTYLDWQFWAAIVALLALVLSQLPPVHLLLRRARLGVELYSRVQLFQKVGNPNVQLHVILSNLGGRPIRVRALTMQLRRNGQDLCTLPAQNYLPTPGSSQTVLFTPFSIKPNEEWANIVTFLNYFAREDEKKYRAAERAIKVDIAEKRKALVDDKVLVEADPRLVAPFTEMFAKWFIWKPGEYELRVNVKTDSDRSSVTKAYRFTLFESDSADLESDKDDFKSGDGIYWTSGNHSGVLVQITEA